MKDRVTTKELQELTVAQLLERHSQAAVIRAIKEQPKKKRGRKADKDWAAITIWTVVEFKKKQTGCNTHKACEEISDLLKRFTTFRNLGVSHLETLYAYGAKRLDTEPDLLTQAMNDLNLLKERSVSSPSALVLPYLGKSKANGLATNSLDFEALERRNIREVVFHACVPPGMKFHVEWSDEP